MSTIFKKNIENKSLARRTLALDQALKTAKDKLFGAAYTVMTVRDWKDYKFSERDIQSLKEAVESLEVLSDIVSKPLKDI